MKSLFAALAKVEQVRELDPEDEDGQIIIARNYLQATNFGTSDEIEEEIANWKESNRLEKKAKDFKPKLDQMQKQQVEYQLAQQAEFNRQQREAAQMYVSNVGHALQKGDLNGIKLDRKTQAMLYEGLTNVAYPSASGKATNLLGHMLDRIQYVEPNFELLAEVTYLLADPDGYRNSIRQQGKNAAVTETVKKLKTEQLQNNGSYSVDDVEETKSSKKKLIKPKNLFER
jgi:DNA-directed RNA polymerase beta' subunit